jgi:hypothetical protein
MAGRPCFLVQQMHHGILELGVGSVVLREGCGSGATMRERDRLGFALSFFEIRALRTPIYSNFCTMT